MVLEEAIKNAEEIAKEKRYEYQECIAVHDIESATECSECGVQHEQFAEWLKELKQLREQTRWIPVEENLPELKVNTGTKNHPVMESEPVYITYMDFAGKRRVCYIPCFLHENGKWYTHTESLEEWVSLDEDEDYINYAPLRCEVIAWRPLLQPYKEESEGER